MKKSSKKIIIMVVIGIAFSLLFCWGYVCYASSTVDIDLKEVTELEQTETIGIEVQDIVYDEFGNARINVLARNENLTYAYHNWTLGDGEGEYKKIKIVIIIDDEVIGLKTYPKNLDIDENERLLGYETTDGITAYVKKDIFYGKDARIAVVFSDREDNNYLTYQNKENEKKFK